VSSSEAETNAARLSPARIAVVQFEPQVGVENLEANAAADRRTHLYDQMPGYRGAPPLPRCRRERRERLPIQYGLTPPAP
jgi:hypothetical protein